MNIELRRYHIRPETIDGRIYIDGGKVCDSAENARHCLPPGNYQIIVHKCRQHSRKMPVIKFMDNSRVIHGNSCFQENPCKSCTKLSFVGNNTTMPMICPMLKPGNGVYKRTDGSIIVGKHLTPGCLSHTKSAFDNLYDRIRKNLERGSPVTLTIK